MSKPSERGVSPVVSATLVIALVVMAMAVYLQQVVPSYQRKNEIDHMNAARDAMLSLQGMILSRKSGEITLPMSPDDTPIFTLPQPASRIEVTPAKWVKRFQPIEDAYVDEVNDGINYGTDNVLSVRSYMPVSGASAYIPQNRRVYIKFDVMSQFIDASTGQLGINPDRVSEAWLCLYCENISKFMGAPWDMGDAYDPATQLWVDRYFLPDMPIRVEARQVLEDWTESGGAGITWDTQPAYGNTIAALKWPWEDNHTIKDNEAWFTWDVTSWVREELRAGEDVSILLKAAYENSSQERYANFSSRQRENGLSITTEADAVNEDEDTSDSKITGHPPYLKPYLAVFYENGDLPGPPLFDNWGALLEGGNITFDTSYYNFPETSFTFESGALFQQLYGSMYTLLISDPGVVLGTRLDADTYNDNISIYVNRYRIVNKDVFSAASDVKLKVTVTENFDESFYPTSGPNNWEITSDGPMKHLENVMITFRTDFEWPWKYYLRDLTMKWNTSTSKGGLEYQTDFYGGYTDYAYHSVVEFQAKLYVDRNIRLYSWGRIENVYTAGGAEVNDIYYYDRTYDVEVKIVV